MARGARRRHAPDRLPALAAVLPAAGACMTFRCAELSLGAGRAARGHARPSPRAGSSSSGRSRGAATTGSSPRARRCCWSGDVRGTVPRTCPRDGAGTSCARTAPAIRAARSAGRPSRRRSSACCRGRSTSARTSAGTASPRTCSCSPTGSASAGSTRAPRVALAAELEAGRLPLDHLRGRTALEPEQQAAEILVRRELGLTRLDDLRHVEDTTFELADGRRATARLHAHELAPQRVSCRDDKVEAATRWELEELVLA